MTQTDKPSVHEMNAIIAAYDGWEQYESGEWYHPGKKQLVKMTPIPRKLKYHSSWAWLMPVGKKINDWLVVQFKGRPANTCSNGDLLEVDIHCAIREYNIEKAHKAIYEFIQWYNSLKK